MVTENQFAREIEEDKPEVLKSWAFEEWLSSEKENSTVLFSGMDWSDLGLDHLVKMIIALRQ